MTSPLESKLLAKIQATADPAVRAEHVADLACYLARIGEFDRAEQFRSELRRDYGDGRDLRVSVLIMTLEALLLYFRELSPKAKDRLVRAKLLCGAGKEQQLLALTSAWLAHIEFNLGEFEAMETSIGDCINSLSADDGSAECRVALVLGDAFMHCGGPVPARRWYERARLAATKLGDQAAVGALTYNRAALRVASLRTASLTLPYENHDFALAKSELSSAINYQAVAGLLSLDHLLKAAQVGVLILEQNFNAALTAIDAIFESGSIPPTYSAQLTLKSDRARCAAELGQVDLAKSCAQGISTSEVRSLEPDDSALCFSNLARCTFLCGDISLSENFAQEMRDALRIHTERTSRLRKLVARYEMAGA